MVLWNFICVSNDSCVFDLMYLYKRFFGNSGATLYQLYQQMVAGGATPTEAMSYLKKSGYDLSQLFAGQ